jgi:hypothetical protein
MRACRPREVESPTPVTTGRRGDRGASACGRSDRFGLSAAVSCVFPLRVSSGCWLGLALRSSCTPVATWA